MYYKHVTAEWGLEFFSSGHLQGPEASWNDSCICFRNNYQSFLFFLPQTSFLYVWCVLSGEMGRKKKNLQT